MSADSASDVSGPVATMTGDQPLPAGMAGTSSREQSSSADARASASVTCRENSDAIDGERRSRRNTRPRPPLA